MTASEKAAYLKGLAEGLGINDGTPEGKLMLAIIDVIDSVAKDVEDLEANSAELASAIDGLSEDIAYVEDLAIGGIENEDECDFDECDGDFEPEIVTECSGECAGCSGCGEAKQEEQEYEVSCSKCGEVITVYKSDLEFGSILCPSCNSELEFDLDTEED